MAEEKKLIDYCDMLVDKANEVNNALQELRNQLNNVSEWGVEE